MATNDRSKEWAEGIVLGMGAGNVTIPYPLLLHYKNLRLTEMEVLLLMQLLAFNQIEHNDFPSLDQLEERMGCSVAELSIAIRRLLQEEWISIDENTDPATGLRSERYNLSGMYVKLGQWLAQEHADKVAAQVAARAVTQAASHSAEWIESPLAGEKEEMRERNLFVIYEREFARPLSPMEMETISGWIDIYHYPEELILLALKEAVFSGKVHLRYIDRILLEWSRNRVTTVEEAKAYTQRFRSGLR